MRKKKVGVLEITLSKFQSLNLKSWVVTKDRFAVSWSIESVSTLGDCPGFRVIIGLINDFKKYCLAPS